MPRDTLRSDIIRLASTLPPGNATRKVLLDALKTGSGSKTALRRQDLLARFLQSAIQIDAKQAFQKRLQKWVPGATVSFDIVSHGLQVRLWLPGHDEEEAWDTAHSILGSSAKVAPHKLTGDYVATGVLTWADIK